MPSLTIRKMANIKSDDLSTSKIDINDNNLENYELSVNQKAPFTALEHLSNKSVYNKGAI